MIESVVMTTSQNLNDYFIWNFTFLTNFIKFIRCTRCKRILIYFFKIGRIVHFFSLMRINIVCIITDTIETYFAFNKPNVDDDEPPSRNKNQAALFK